MKEPDYETKFVQALALLHEASNYFSDNETAPNEKWWKQFFLLDGAHMILTDEGWESGCGKEQYEKDAKEDGVPLSDFIRDEVNSPVRKKE